MSVCSLVIVYLLSSVTGTTDVSASPWVEIVGPTGPTGLVQEFNERIVFCRNVKLDSGSQGLVTIPGEGVIAATTNLTYGENNNVRSRQEFGDCEVHLEFLIGNGSNSGVKLQSRYEVQIYDSHDSEKPNARECGGVYPHWVFRKDGGLKYIDEGVPPLRNAAKPAGEWQTLKIVFQAPRFNEAGKKVKNARLVSVMLNDEKIHENIELESPTGNASTPLPEVAKAPLYLQLDHGPVAFRNVRVKPLKL